MFRIILSAYQWGRAIRPPRYLCKPGKAPTDHSNVKIHIHERGHKRALCGFVPAYQWDGIDNPDGLTPICDRCLYTAINRRLVVDSAVKKKIDKHRKSV